MPGVLSFALPESGDYFVLRNIKVKLVTSNLRSFEVWASMLDRALPGTRAGASYFVWMNDFVGQASAWKVIQAQRRGVDTTVIVDGLGSFGKQNELLWSAMAREGVKVYIYNPLLKNPGQLNLRSHVKALHVQTGPDQVEADWEGRNISQHYRIAHETFDTGVRVTMSKAQGDALFEHHFHPLIMSEKTVRWVPPVTYGDAEHFVAMKEFKKSSEFMNDLLVKHLAEETDYPETKVNWGLYLQNDHKSMIYRSFMERLIASADSLYFANAYFIPRTSMIKALANMLRRNALIMGFTNSRHSTQHTNIIRLMKDTVTGLLAKGLNLFIRKEGKGEVHAKVTIIDHEIVSIGSDNWDHRRDLQNGLVFYSPEVAKQVETHLIESLHAGDYEYTHNVYGGGVRDFCMRLLLKPIKWFF